MSTKSTSKGKHCQSIKTFLSIRWILLKGKVLDLYLVVFNSWKKMEPLYLWKKFHKAFVGFLSNQHIKRENLPLDCETDSEFQSVRPWSFGFADLVLVLRPFITK